MKLPVFELEDFWKKHKFAAPLETTGELIMPGSLFVGSSFCIGYGRKDVSEILNRFEKYRTYNEEAY